MMADHTIWIDGRWWLLAWLVLALAIGLPIASRDTRSADIIAGTIGSAVAALIIIGLVAWLSGLVGYQLGISE